MKIIAKLFSKFGFKKEIKMDITAIDMQKFYDKNRKKDSLMLGEGASRKAFYCKEFDCVLKYEHNTWGGQTEQEVKFFEQLKEEEKKFFPVIAYGKVEAYGHTQYCIAMRKATVFSQDDDFQKFCNDRWLSQDEIIDKAKEFYNLKDEVVQEYRNFIQKYQIRDLHRSNVGVLGDTIVVIDAGLVESCNDTYNETYYTSSDSSNWSITSCSPCESFHWSKQSMTKRQIGIGDIYFPFFFIDFQEHKVEKFDSKLRELCHRLPTIDIVDEWVCEFPNSPEEYQPLTNVSSCFKTCESPCLCKRKDSKASKSSDP